jgi:hypothetical protein
VLELDLEFAELALLLAVMARGSGTLLVWIVRTL